jgi:holliday junction DNA helicase RuvA
MIGRLRGRVDEINEDSLILDVGGVGYHVFCSARHLASLSVGEAALIITEMHVREDHIHLFGFASNLERDWFRLLATVQGVGNKTAQTILSAYGAPQLLQAIISKDIAAFKAISGIGPKLAERIVTELKDKVLKMPTDTAGFAPTPATSTNEKTTKSRSKAAAAPAPANHTDDVISALVNLGYSRSEAYTAALKAAQDEPGANLDALIKRALKELMR